MTLAEGATLLAGFRPWNLYYTYSTVSPKLKQYCFLRSKLHLKVVTNASPFRYTLGMMSYQTLAGDGEFPFAGGVQGADYNGVSNDGGYMGRSQRPHVLFTPQNCAGCEMTLPFVYYKDWIEMKDTTSFGLHLGAMGTVWLETLMPLRSAAAASSDPITVTVYAWASDVELSGASLQLQAGDEYSDTPVSATASAIGAAASALSRVPIIGPYARATAMTAGHLASWARWMGFSNPPVIAPVAAFHPSIMPNLCSPDISNQMEKMSLDPKNELTVDSRVVGGDGTDELAMASLLSRESYLCQTNWHTSDASAQTLLSGYLVPEYYLSQDKTSGTYTYYQISQTPMCHVAQMFRYWRGSIKLKFLVVASQFHRGRLRFTYDPAGKFTTIQEGVLFTQIIDISETDSFEVIIPYHQATQWLVLPHHPQNLDVAGSPYIDSIGLRGDPAFAYDANFFNGYFRLDVLTELGSAGVASDAQIFLFVSGGDDLEMACPEEIQNANLGFFEPTGLVLQAAPERTDVDLPIPTEKPSLVVKLPSSEPKRGVMYTVYMGEVVRSVRQLLHRATYHTTISPVLPATGGTSSITNLVEITLPRFPRYSGKTPIDNLHLTSTEVGFNYVGMSPLNWMTPCFVGYRGSIVWRAAFYANDGITKPSFLTVKRNRPEVALGVTVTANDVSSSNRAALAQDVWAESLGGIAATTYEQVPELDCVMPMYSKYSMLPACPTMIDGSTSAGSQVMDKDDKVSYIYTYVSAASAPSNIQTALVLYVAAGVDFSPVIYMNVPTMWRISLAAQVAPNIVSLY